MTERYELGAARPARRSLAERLPADVAAAAVEFMTGRLLDSPRRIGKPLRDELTGVYSARLGSGWRVFHEIDEERRVVVVLDIRPRATAYRPR